MGDSLKLSNRTVLIVDDETALLDMLEILLTPKGYTVVTAQDGVEALDVVKTCRPDAIILDVMMPRMSGYMVASLLKKSPEYEHIPIILLTATAQIAGNITLATPTPYCLKKPFKTESLLSVLDEVFQAIPD
ncbi:two-component system response regulator [Candidatus Marinamargulisbacteria bacterium SCGC AG-439-L15]|nr:two-component system response regulator [Candidatus Marinamargulisbacteria bacterium SCGC AG-439-L15]